MGRLENQSVLITGGASGLGEAIVERFIDEGAGVGVLDRSAEGCAALADRLGDRVVCTAGDVRSYDDNHRAVATCLDRFGKLDAVIGNAGIWDYNATLADLPADKLAETFDELFGINVLGYMMLAKAALQALASNANLDSALRTDFDVTTADEKFNNIYAAAGKGLPLAVVDDNGTLVAALHPREMVEEMGRVESLIDGFVREVFM